MDLALDSRFGRIRRPFVHGVVVGLALGTLTALLAWGPLPRHQLASAMVPAHLVRDTVNHPLAAAGTHLARTHASERPGG